MAITYGFYNSMNGDRKYDAVQLSSIFDGVIRDGVFQSIGGYLATKPGTGMQVIVSPGKAWFDHTWTVNDADLPLEIAKSDLTLSRYDAVVLETDATKSVRENSIKVVKGTPASDPQKPTLTNEGDVHQHPLAYILVPGGSTEIQVQNIDIMVGKDECPFVTSILESVSIEVLLEKWEGEFRKWFDELQDQMSGDVATNLQNQITKNAGVVGDIAFSMNDSKPGPWLMANGESFSTVQYPELYAVLKRINASRKLNGLWEYPLIADCLFAGGKALYRKAGAYKKWYFADAGGPFSDTLAFTASDMLTLGTTNGRAGQTGSYYGFYYVNGLYIFAYCTTEYKLAIYYSEDGSIWTKTLPMATDSSRRIIDFGGMAYVDGKYVFEAITHVGNYYYAGLGTTDSLDGTWSFSSVYNTRDSTGLMWSISPVVSPDKKYVFSGGYYQNDGIVVKRYTAPNTYESASKIFTKVTKGFALFSVGEKMYCFDKASSGNSFQIYEFDYDLSTWANTFSAIKTLTTGAPLSGICYTDGDSAYIYSGQDLISIKNGDVTVYDSFYIDYEDGTTGVGRNLSGINLLYVDDDGGISVATEKKLLTNMPTNVPAIPYEFGYAYIRKE